MPSRLNMPSLWSASSLYFRSVAATLYLNPCLALALASRCLPGCRLLPNSSTTNCLVSTGARQLQPCLPDRPPSWVPLHAPPLRPAPPACDGRVERLGLGGSASSCLRAGQQGPLFDQQQCPLPIRPCGPAACNWDQRTRHRPELVAGIHTHYSRDSSSEF